MANGKKKITLVCGDDLNKLGNVSTFYSHASADAVNDALRNARAIINDWLEDKEIPSEYEDCFCDQEFYVRSLEISLPDLEYEDCDEEIVWEY